MKTVKHLKDIDNRVIVDMNLKKTFEYRGYNFAICTEPEANHKYYTLIHFQSGGKLPMFLPTNKTIKHFYERSLEAIDTLINRIGEDSFINTLNSHPTIN